MRQEPIPSPSEPMQYRAIGLVQGKYVPSDEQLNAGQLLTPDGRAFQAILLGRVLSLVKNHLTLDEEHLWVVYPRTQDVKSKKPRRASEEPPPPELRLQIVGIWEPETLHRALDEQLDEEMEGEAPAEMPAASGSEDPSEADAPILSRPVHPTDAEEEEGSKIIEDGYFSVRGEVIYHAANKNRVIVKIQQLNRKNPKLSRDFKVHLFGNIEQEAVLHHFWDLQVQRQADRLTIIQAQCVGPMPPQRRKKADGNRKPFKRRGAPASGTPRPPRSGSGSPVPRPKPSLSKSPQSDLGSGN